MNVSPKEEPLLHGVEPGDKMTPFTVRGQLFLEAALSRPLVTKGGHHQEVFFLGRTSHSFQGCFFKEAYRN